MLLDLLTRISAGLPSAVKYKLNALRRPYTFVLRLGKPVVQVPTVAGKVNWEIDELTSQQIVRGSYEPYMQNAFVEFIREGSVVYDVGAHAGYHSLLCGLLVGPTGRVVAFEPHPLNCRSIQRQLELNPTLNVTLVRHALSDVCSRVYLDSTPGRSQTHINESGEFEVEAKTIDDLVETGALPPPQLIKIDVEGHEAQVLRGGLKTIQTHKPIVLCDHNDSRSFGIVNELMTPLGYDVTNGALVVSIPKQIDAGAPNSVR